jgi:2-keto-4-pentenoate hydratase
VSREQDVAMVTALLVEARRSRRSANAASAVLADAEAAYAVQDAVAKAMDWTPLDGAPMHWKSGGPSREAVPTHAALPAEGVWQSPARASDWPFRLRGIEAEIALRLAQAVAPAQAAGLGHEESAALVDAMCVSIEVVDSRWNEGLDAPALAKLADLQSHGALVLGEWVPFAPRDWSSQSCRVSIGTQAPVEHTGSHLLGDPLYGLPQWLRHATRHGATVRAGTVLTTGTWVGILHAAPGDLVHAEFPGIGQASVQL